MDATGEVYRLPEDHGWTARPGYKILVLDRGAVRLEFPKDWIVQLGPQQIDIRDRASPEESSCVLAASYLRLPPVDWSLLPLSQLLLEAVRADAREHIGCGPVIEATRGGRALAWTERRLVDSRQRREARCRMCLARGHGFQCLITLDFWPEDGARLGLVWENVLDSLELGVRVDDPTRGERIW